MKKGLFSGWKDVFYFTYQQGVKGIGFKLSTIGIALLLFASMIGANIFMATGMDKDKKDVTIETVYVIDESGLQGVDFSMLPTISGERYAGVTFETSTQTEQEVATSLDKGSKKDIILHITKGDENYLMKMVIPSVSSVTEEEANDLLDAAVPCLEQSKLISSGISVEKLVLATSPIETIFTDAGEEPESMGEEMIKIVLPMMVIFLLYMMVILYGQSIGKIVSAEKTSKLMETLLTSVRPYAVIAGKILAMTTIALMQMFLWIAGLVGGFIVGDKIALQMEPGYENEIMKVIDLLKSKEAGVAFSLPAVILALFVICVGFLFYCVLAGLFASSISKAEELAQLMGLFQLIVVVSFMGAYIVPIQGNEGINTILRCIPFTAAFMLPGDLLVGNVTLVGASISLAILVVATVGLILITGMIYKGKIFYRGSTNKDALSFLKKFIKKPKTQP